MLIRDLCPLGGTWHSWSKSNQAYWFFWVLCLRIKEIILTSLKEPYSWSLRLAADQYIPWFASNSIDTYAPSIYFSFSIPANFATSYDDSFDNLSFLSPRLPRSQSHYLDFHPVASRPQIICTTGSSSLFAERHALLWIFYLPRWDQDSWSVK